jgi:hypothetical protein
MSNETDLTQTQEAQPQETHPPAPVGDDSAVPAAPLGNEGVTGEVDNSDIDIPYLVIVPKTGGLADTFPPRTVTISAEVPISDGKSEPLEVSVLSIKKYFLEVVDYESDETPRRWDTRQEVLDEGLSLQGYKDPDTKRWIQPDAKPAARALIAVRAPENLSPEAENYFPHEIQVAGEEEPRRFALLLWSIKNSAYRAAATTIFSAAKFAFKGDLKAGSFLLSTKIAKFGENSVVQPDLKFGKRQPKEVVEFFDTVLNG